MERKLVQPEISEHLEKMIQFDEVWDVGNLWRCDELPIERPQKNKQFTINYTDLAIYIFSRVGRSGTAREIAFCKSDFFK